jgi:hypothetical protein
MYIKHQAGGNIPKSQIILDIFENAAAGTVERGNAFGILLEKATELHDACETVARDAILNPTCHDPAFARLTPQERIERAKVVSCHLAADWEQDFSEGTVTLGSGCVEDCHLRPSAIADPGVIVVDNTYPILIDEYRKNR